MPGTFAITTITNTIPLDDTRQNQVAFTVSNLSGRPMRGRARVVALTTAATPWLSLVGEPERSLPIAATEQFVVQINVPPTTPAGSYSFRLDMVGVDNPDEDYTQGPTVAFTVPAPAVIVKKPFPWQIAAAVAVVLVLVIGILVVVFRQNAKSPTPLVAGEIALLNNSISTVFMEVEFAVGSAKSLNIVRSDTIRLSQRAVIPLQSDWTNITVRVRFINGREVNNFHFDAPVTMCYEVTGDTLFPTAVHAVPCK